MVLQETVGGVQRVVDCTAPARALGVRPGMPVAEAAALAGIAALVLESHAPRADREALRRLAAACNQFSPLVGLESAERPECLLLDVTGLEHLFGGEPALAKRVAREMARQGWWVRLAIADTIGTAWAMAHYGAEAVTIVAHGRSAEALWPLPIESLRLPVELGDRLHALGIERVEQLAALPRREWTSRFGSVLLSCWDRAFGLLDEPLVPCRPLPAVRAEYALEHATARRDAIEHLVGELVEQVAAQLLRHGLGALRLECRLAGDSAGSEAAATVRFSVGLFRPTVSARHLFPLIRMQLERASLPAAVAAIELEVTQTAPLEHRQRELFPQEPAPRHPDELAVLIERLSSRLGNDAVARIRLVADAQPELAYRALPLVQNRYRRPAPVPPDREGLPPRPLKLLPRPVPLVVAALSPDGPPVQFDLRGRRHRAAYTWGPERIETGWWRGQTVGRDYYRVETEAGERYWLFRRLRDGLWFLHGMFE